MTLATGSVLKGSVGVKEASVTAANAIAAGVSLSLTSGASLSIASKDAVTVGSLFLEEATVTGAGTLNISSTLTWEKEGEMAGTGQTVLEGGASAGILEGGAFCPGPKLVERSYVNDGTTSFSSNSTGSTFYMAKGARIYNNGTFQDNSNGNCEPFLHTFLIGPGRAPEVINTGLFERTHEPREPFTTQMDVQLDNWGRTAGTIVFPQIIQESDRSWGCSQENPSFPKREIASEQGVCTASGDLSETQTDFAIGGRGVGLNLTRTYNSQAAQEGAKSTFGNGWSSPYSEHLTPETLEGEEGEPATHLVTLVQENGSHVTFTEGTGGSWVAPEGSPDTLTGSSSIGYTLTLENRDTYKFSGSSGRLESIADANANTTTCTYNEAGELEKVTDPTGRTLKFA